MSDRLDIDVVIEDDRWLAVSETLDRLVRDAAEKTLHAALTQGSGMHIDQVKAVLKDTQDGSDSAGDPALSICFVFSTDDAVRGLNRDYRDQDKATNVLSFAALDEEVHIPPGEQLPQGDAVFAHETIIQEAEETEKPVLDHLSHLIVHGVLHLLGYDHQKDAEAVQMESLETQILHVFGIPDPNVSAA